jgi:hypothetical protein
MQAPGAIPITLPVEQTKNKKGKKSKSKDGKSGEHHYWDGRTPGEVACDDAVEAAKTGANEPKEVRPVAKPGDRFWVMEHDGSKRWVRCERDERQANGQLTEAKVSTELLRN